MEAKVRASFIARQMGLPPHFARFSIQESCWKDTTTLTPQRQFFGRTAIAAFTLVKEWSRGVKRKNSFRGSQFQRRIQAESSPELPHAPSDPSRHRNRLAYWRRPGIPPDSRVPPPSETGRRPDSPQ